jgi:hypothetical protein
MSPQFNDDEIKQLKKEQQEYDVDDKKEQQTTKNELKGKMRQNKKINKRP